MKVFMLAMMALGAALLGFIVYETDLSEVWARLAQVGPWGIALIMGVYLASFAALSTSWLVTLPSISAGPRSMFRFWKLLMVGSALDHVTPFGGLGGEPVKAILLKRRYGVHYAEATTSLVLARTTDLMAQLVFITIGFALMLRAELLPAGYRTAAGAGLALLTSGFVLFFLAQNRGLLSKLHAWLERGWLDRGRLSGRQLGRRIAEALGGLQDVEQRLLAFYRRERARVAGSVGLAFVSWLGDAFATYLAVNLLGYPIGFVEALVIESFVALVRSALFFVPADLGTQEGAQVLICSAITGSPALGLALAAIRRARDLVWILGGLAIGSHYSMGAELEARGDAQQPTLDSADRPV